MEVYLNRIDGWDDAILTMFYSKRTVTRELENEIRLMTYLATVHDPRDGVIGRIAETQNCEVWDKVSDWLDKLMKWAPKHITMGRFLDFSFTVYGMHRAGQDDWDAHAKRMENRVIRSSTRLADFSAGEMSEYYQGKIIPTDLALAIMGLTKPDELEYDGKTYVSSVNGYVLKGHENNRDVKRGLYMLSIPSNFIFKINLTEFAHVYKERNETGGANPEVKIGCEDMLRQLQKNSVGYLNRDLMMRIQN